MNRDCVSTWRALLGGLRGGMDRQMVVIAIIFAAFCAAVAILFATAGLPQGKWIATSSLAIGSFALSHLCAQCLRRLVRGAQLSLLPGTGPYVRRAALTQWLIIGLAPALLILTLGGSEIHFCAVALAALFGQVTGTYAALPGALLAATGAFFVVVFRRSIVGLTQQSLWVVSVLLTVTLLSWLVWIWRAYLRSVPAETELPAGSRWGLPLSHLLRSPGPAGRQQPLSPTMVMRTFMAAPYAPATAAQRALQVGLILVVMCVPAALAFALGRSHTLRDLERLLHAAWAPTLWVSGLVIWGWLLRGQVTSFSRGSGNLDELALLPMLGSAAMRRRQLYQATLRPPILVLSMLFLVALVPVIGDADSFGIYTRIAYIFSLLPALTLLGWQLPGHPTSRQAWMAAPVVLLGQSSTVFLFSHPVFNARELDLVRLICLTCWVLLGIAAVEVMLFKSRRLAERPHPFVEIAS
ncbi:MAG TPA: hypothetical protein VNZ06_09775 [Steroidobacteraceae bacterium]|jgi:hypothetical protein|nr:hypothetical protein [Steroidobacteraceae bacterium]